MKKWTLLLFALSLICMLTGCAGQNEEEEGSGYQIWYVEQDETGLDYERIEVAETDAEGMTGALKWKDGNWIRISFIWICPWNIWNFPRSMKFYAGPRS